jgi:hypothetical protein
MNERVKKRERGRNEDKEKIIKTDFQERKGIGGRKKGSTTKRERR